MRSSLYVGLALCLVATTPVLAIECPVVTNLDTPATIQVVQKILPAQVDLDAPGAVESAIHDLAVAGVPDDLSLDNLIAAYCVSLADEPGVSEITKTQKVQDYAIRIEPLVYSDRD